MKKKNISKQEEIKFLIKESDLTFKEIAKKTNSHINTVYNINKGRTHFDLDEEYPLRSRDGDRVARLVERLRKPSLKALPQSNIISVYLLGYISFLSFIESPVECLLVFKHLYERDVAAVVGRELSDQELVDLFKLNPQQPETLQILLNAYFNPSLSMTIIKYWGESGFLKGEELQDVFKILARQ